MRKEGIFVRGSSVVRTGWSLREAISYLYSLPVDLVKAQAVRLPPGHPLSLTAMERAQYFHDLKELARSVSQGLRKGFLSKDDRFDSRVLQIMGRIRRTSFCGAGRSVFGLAADGTVLPCALLAGFKDADLGRIDGPVDWVKKGRSWADTHGPRAECRTCWALPLCGGGCPAMLSVCGEDECEMVRANCEAALEIYGAFLKRPSDLLLLAGRA
jgi:radical SAM protein with 4Fe4S-binding SPASM domain